MSGLEIADRERFEMTKEIKRELKAHRARVQRRFDRLAPYPTRIH
jgi:hypothetical protein